MCLWHGKTMGARGRPCATASRVLTFSMGMSAGSSSHPLASGRCSTAVATHAASQSLGLCPAVGGKHVMMSCPGKVADAA